ncbi:MAG TPA: CBS domain-containing protein [Gemmatimonadaceae bacterium]|nr:CBS domain-containing protein [Gemmatimonadaceae bacterium]
MNVQEIMTRDPACATPGMTARDAARLMQREDTGVLPVVESEESRKLLGVLTDRDLAIRVVAEGRGAETRVSDIMSADRLATARPEDSVDRVMEAMGEEQVRRIPIVDERGALVGIVSQADIVLKARDEHKAEQTVEEISTPGGKHNR